ncbi:MAG: hypothetical protein JWR72_224 [Flavisolibacter sp.]|nr:hypothetical protein [Flavisolibacter sp.]
MIEFFFFVTGGRISIELQWRRTLVQYIVTHHLHTSQNLCVDVNPFTCRGYEWATLFQPGTSSIVVFQFL